MPDLGVVTITEETFNTVKKIKFEWTSENGGADAGKASKTTTKVYTGEIIRLVTIPAAAGDAPTDDYDITINDEDGTDVLMGAGANRDTANTEQVLATSLGCVAYDKLTINVSNAGNAKKGAAIIYIR
jgi:uncharacterized protein (DUF342 family)